MKWYLHFSDSLTRVYTLGNQCFIVRKTKFYCAAAKGVEMHRLGSTYSDFKKGMTKTVATLLNQNCSTVTKLNPIFISLSGAHWWGLYNLLLN